MSSENTEHKPRHFLVVVDDTPECRKALRFAARRAHSVDNGGVMLLRVTEPPDFQHWMGVGDLMRAEAREKIEERFAFFREKMLENEGVTAELVIREGETAKEVLAQIKDDPEIGVLVLGAGTGRKGPGPLVTAMSKNAGTLPIPMTIVPGELSKEQLEAIT